MCKMQEAANCCIRTRACETRRRHRSHSELPQMNFLIDLSGLGDTVVTRPTYSARCVLYNNTQRQAPNILIKCYLYFTTIYMDRSTKPLVHLIASLATPPGDLVHSRRFNRSKSTSFKKKQAAQESHTGIGATRNGVLGVNFVARI